jgi:predicted nucleic-acid-binding protein
MAETKNVFLGAKMNKDLDPRLVSNREYIEARNASVTDSAGGDSGVLENVLGNIELTDFKVLNTYTLAYDTKLKIIGFYVDTTNDRLFAFLTNYTDSSATSLTNPAPAASGHYIAVYNTISNDYTVLVGGSFLNFSDTHEVLGIDLIENLLFFTDNRNQPRKINVNLALANPYGSANPYYTSEDHISVAKYYPCLSPDITTLNGDGTLFDGSVLQIQTNWNFTAAGAGTSAIFTVGTGGVTTSGSGATGLAFQVSRLSTGGTAGFYTFTLSSATISAAAAVGYAPGDTITIPNALLLSTFGPATGPYGAGDAVFVVSRANMARTPSMWDVTSPLLPDGTTSNPYYDATFTGDGQFLSDKFVRFSYRFKFEDNEYSLIAPFSQAAFIPKQDGYFLEDSIPTSILDDAANSDEVNTIKSTIVEFFENKVNKIDISIPMPDGVTLGNATTNLYDKYKVTAIDVLYKESDGTTIRVIETITFDKLETATGIDYVYSYDSSKPIKALPSKETIRVSDRVPLRAKAQAVAGNRVMYGNLTLRSASLDSLNYTVTAGDKVAYGTGSSTSQREYPNHTLKQNRTYQVGVVLSDKYGRQSDVILSPNSTVFHPYKTAVMDLEYLGDSLQVQFNAPIPTNSSNIGYVGLYDETTNPLGWYSYKFVVKQQEQSYYNVYLPTILNGYPQDVNSGGPTTYTTVADEAYITLFSDNINKVPRDLQEVGPQDVQFSSSVRLFGRVYNTTFSSTAATNEQYFPGNIGDEVTLIGDRDEIGLDRTDEGDEYYSSPFYSIPTQGIGDTAGDGADLKGANPYIGRVSTVNLIGAVGGGDLTFATAPEVTNLQTRLNVYETAPTVSNLDIFWESSTSGLISDLNTSVEQNFSVLPVKLTNFEWSLSEDDAPLSEIARFDLANAGGVELNSASTTAELIEVRDGNGGIVTNKFTLNKDAGTNEFYITTSTGTYFTYTQFSPTKDNYAFTIKATNSGPASLISTGYGNYLANVVPVTGTVTGSNPLPEIRPPSTWSTFAVLDGNNGSVDTSNEKTGLVWEVTKIEFLWVGNGSVWTEYQTPATDMFRVIKGSGQSVAETLQYNNQLICLDVNATNTTALYTYQNRTSTSVRVTLKLTDASGTGLSDTITYDTPAIVINRTD